MNMSLSDSTKINILAVAICAVFSVGASHAQTASPPALGQETKGAPAIDESTSVAEAIAVETKADTNQADSDGKKTSAFGTSTIIESRRESGQIYSIELQHSNAPTQYIKETDSDGNIESTSNDLEETPNLPKWKLGSW